MSFREKVAWISARSRMTAICEALFLVSDLGGAAWQRLPPEHCSVEAVIAVIVVQVVLTIIVADVRAQRGEVAA